MVDNEEQKKIWGEQRIKLKEKFPYLTTADLEYQDGKKEEMLERLQAVLGKTKADLQRIIEGL